MKALIDIEGYKFDRDEIEASFSTGKPMASSGIEKVLISSDTSSCREKVGYATNVEVLKLKNEDEHTYSSKVLKEEEGSVDSTPALKYEMTFKSLECANEYYNKYAFSVGFKTKLRGTYG
ncbi:hypothetical protein Syun_016543 [Stephania yunnanensis]|uniref:Uncharacterized protein n=1 Tax=Stephania yunnanensis TaxID=152371 RepID=A0AAP0J539_9MAGN